MKLLQKRWVKTILVTAFCIMMPVSVFLDVMSLFEKEMNIEKQEAHEKFKDSTVFKSYITNGNAYMLEELCQSREYFEQLSKKEIVITDIEKMNPVSTRTITWEDFFKENGTTSTEVGDVEKNLWKDGIICENTDISEEHIFLRMKSDDFIELLDLCPYQKIGEMKVEDVEYQLENYLNQCILDWSESNEFDADNTRYYEGDDDNFLLYDESRDIIVGTRLKKTKLSKIRSEGYVYVPMKKVQESYAPEDLICGVVKGFTTSPIEQLRYELFQMTDGDWVQFYSEKIRAIRITKNKEAYVSTGKIRENYRCITFEDREEIDRVFGSGSEFCNDAYEIAIYYDETSLNTAEVKSLEYIYNYCISHADRGNIAIVVTTITLILFLLAIGAVLPSLWKRQEEKARDLVVLELAFAITAAVVLLVIGGLYLLLATITEVLLVYFSVPVVLVCGTILAEILLLLGVGAVYFFISTVIYRIRNHCFANRWLIAKLVQFCIRKIKVVGNNLGILKRRILFLVCIWIPSFIAMAVLCGCASYYADFMPVFGMFCYFVFMISFSVLFIKDALDMQQLLDGCNRMKEGEIGNPIELEKLQYGKKELAQAINTIGEGLEKAVQTSMKDERMKTELITNVSHDIKTPLTSIINYVDLMKREGITEEERAEYLKVLDTKSQRLKQLIEDLVEVSKTSTGNLELQMEKLDFKELLNQALGEFGDKFAERNLEMIVSLSEYKALIWADGRRCYRILENLFTNVYKYAMPNTRVYVDLQLDEKQMVFTIKNISEAPLNIPVEELMERFVRGDASRSTSGSGLGLSIAENLVKLQNGQLNIKLDGDLFRVEVRFPVI